MMRRWNISLLVAIVAATLINPVAQADAPSLQVAPLQYTDTLKPGIIKQGYVDVANPGDSVIEVTSQVRGFKQIGTNGDLDFFDDPDLAAAITVGLTDFSLGPREAVRVTFNVDPAKLPAGGVYAAIFFRTQSPDQTSSSSYVAQSANVGTLLILTNGPDTTHYGVISAVHLPFWQFGYGITGSLDYRNTDTSTRPIGFRPSLTLSVGPWGAKPQLNTGLVLPGITRHFPILRPGSYFGLLPVTITDSDTHRSTVIWVFACTGYGGLVAFIICIILASGLAMWLYRRRRPPTHQSLVKRSIDGLSVKPHHAKTVRSTPAMEPESFTASASVTINASPEQVWQALTDPELIKQYMFGAQVETDWQVDSPIIYKGEWEGKPYEDKGTILEIEPQKLLKSTYFSPLSGQEDKPENYQTVTYELQADDEALTKLTVTQTNSATQEAADKAKQNWDMVLTSIKQLIEAE